MLHAGGASQRLRFVRSDLSTLLRLQARLQKAGLDASLLSKALDRAAAFSAASIQTVVSRQGGDEQALAHFREATQAIEGLREANETIGDLLSAEAQQDLTRAERGRALSLAVMGLIVLLLGGLYATFERSTVLRLRSLAQSSRRMAGGHFTDTVTVDGSDEIAALGTALDEMRQTLQDAIEQKALALAAQDADRAKTEFLARWSHDLRTPLAAVLGFAQVLEERRDGQLSPAQHEDVARIRTAAEHLLRLVQDVLDIASIEARGPSLVLEAIDPDALAAEAVELVASNAQAQAQAQGISLSMGRSAQPCHVRADRTRLLQVLLNLLTNAIKFNRSGGLARIDIQASADEVVIEVSDQGMGLKPSEVARLFKPFVRLDAVERGIPGHGLGLATVRSLVSAMGGTVSVRSAPGQGSTFCVHLRRCEAGPMSTRSASAQMQEAAQALALQGRLAYVEDDEVNVLLMQAMIERHTGLQLSTFPDAAAALAAAEDFDCWIIDLHLPDSDGLRLFEAIQARRGSAVRAILFSADAQPRLRQQALEAGFIDHWTKPMAWESMRTALMRLKSPPG
jgi:signal transduction histidine kinase/CheY-like chemotaxis protein